MPSASLEVDASLLASIGLQRPADLQAEARAAPRGRRPARPAPAAASDPLSMTARRTSAPGTPAAFATASVITPSSAPCRSSPESSRTRNSCSGAVAAANSSATSRLRSAVEPLPATAPIRVNAASTASTVSDAVPAGGGTARSAAHPTPICRCGSSPDR